MTTVQKIKPPRTYPTINGVFAIRARIRQASPSPALGEFTLVNTVPFCIGTLPKGAFVLPSAKHVIVAFDGTTPALNMGTLATPNAFMPTASIAPGSIGFAGAVQGTGMGFITDDTPVYVTMTAAGNAVGAADLVLLYYAAQD